MTNFQEIRKEIEKGCGKKLQYTHGDGTVHWKCGETETYNWMYCEVCQAKLEILNKCEDAFKEMIEKFRTKLRQCDEFFDVSDYENTSSTDKFAGIVDIYLDQELLSQLNSKEEKEND